MIVILAAMLAAEGASSLVLDCTVPDRRGKPTSWSVKFDQPMGIVEVTFGKPAVVYKATATYGRDSVKFELFDASIAINRENGAIKRTLIEFGVRNVVEGACITAKGTNGKAGTHAPATSLPALEHQSG